MHYKISVRDLNLLQATSTIIFTTCKKSKCTEAKEKQKKNIEKVVESIQNLTYCDHVQI